MQNSLAVSPLAASLDLGLPLGDLTKAFTEAVAQAEDTGVRVAVLSVTGGGDGPGAAGVHEVNAWERALRRWERLDALTVVIADGPSGGPALEVLSASDLRLAGDGLLLTLPGTAETGFWPGTVLHRLTHRVGARATRRLSLLTDPATPLTAQEAHSLGLVDEVCGPGRCEELLAEVTGRLPARLEPALLRQLVSDAAHTSYEEALGVHLAACDRVLRRATAGSAA
ncbi:MAG TPA: enoyl-CoA-hydratase DpgB [Streptomyces sp.]